MTTRTALFTAYARAVIKSRNVQAQKAWQAMTPLQREKAKDNHAIALGFSCHGQRQAIGENYHRHGARNAR